MAQFAAGFALYRVNFQRQVLDSGFYGNSSSIQPKESCSSLEINLKFETPGPTTNLDLIVIFVFDEFLKIAKTSASDREIQLSLPL